MKEEPLSINGFSESHDKVMLRKYFFPIIGNKWLMQANLKDKSDVYPDAQMAKIVLWGNTLHTIQLYDIPHYQTLPLSHSTLKYFNKSSHNK